MGNNGDNGVNTRHETMMFMNLTECLDCQRFSLFVDCTTTTWVQVSAREQDVLQLAAVPDVAIEVLMLSLSVRIVFCFEWVLLFFHLTVLYFLCRQMHKKKQPFVSGFFAIYTIQGFAECINYLVNSFAFRLVQYKEVSRSVVDAVHYGYWFLFLSGYLCIFEYFTHTLIAVNRYLAIVHPTLRLQVWSGRSLGVVILLQFLVPLIGAGPRLGNVVVTVETDDGMGFKSVNPPITTISGTFSVGISLITSTVSCFLEFKTLFVYRGLGKVRRREHLHDYQLLLYALLGLTAQVLMAAYHTFQYTAGRSTSPEEFIATQRIFPYLVDVLSLLGSVCLFVTSRDLRCGYLEFYGLFGVYKFVKTAGVGASSGMALSIA